MNLAEEAFQELFPGKAEEREFKISYSAKFKPLNANVKYTSNYIHFYLSRDWQEFSDDLKKGLIQHLLLKIFSKYEYEKTMELDLYKKFVSNLGRYAKVDKTDPELEESFNRVNKEYLDGEMDKPNLVWGADAFRKLGHYEYATNTVLISNVFRGEQELLDYIMYHELLHKKHGHKNTGKRTIHHTNAFKEEEAKYKAKDIEKKLKSFLRKKRFRNMLGF
jgi:hypothetical protein